MVGEINFKFKWSPCLGPSQLCARTVVGDGANNSSFDVQLLKSFPKALLKLHATNLAVVSNILACKDRANAGVAIRMVNTVRYRDSAMLWVPFTVKIKILFTVEETSPQVQNFLALFAFIRRGVMGKRAGYAQHLRWEFL
jgi:hypothetical protein